MTASQRVRGRFGVLLLGALAAAGCSETSAPLVPASIAQSGAVPGSAVVATAVTPSVRVADASGKAVKGVSVTFQVSAGGGSVAAASATTNGSGVASPGEWTLGTGVGGNTLIARVSGMADFSITVQGTADVPAAIAGVEGNASTGPAGTALPVPPGAIVRDRHGNPVPGAAVTFTAGPGSGTVTGGAQTTDAAGIARPGAWTLGPGVGQQTMTARVLTITTSITVTAGAGEPASIATAVGNNQNSPVGAAATVPPTVRVADAFGNGVPGVAVQFAVASGGGTITGASQVTGAGGLATVGSWVLGPQMGPQTLSASAGALSTTVTANGVAGPPASLEKNGGDGQQGSPNGAVPTTPSVLVRDQFGNPVSGASVTFEVTGGGGAVANTVSASNAAGVATPGIWQLGPTQGENTLRASLGGLPAVTFTATAAGAPVQSLVIEKFAGDQTTCPLSSVGCSFTVQVKTLLGDVVAGEQVTWSDGSGASVATVTNSKGRSTTTNLSASTLGAATQTARTSTGVETVFQYEVVQAGQYNIEMRFGGSITTSQRAIFDQAKARWEQVITGNLPSVSIPAGFLNADVCGISHPAIVETIDDLLIYINIVAIDGVGGTLGRAGPCVTRNAQSGLPSAGLPAFGVMELDLADVGAMEANGTLLEVFLHEVGHVLGFTRTRWQSKNLIQGMGGENPFFTGTRAKSGFVLGGGTLIDGVPLENTGGEGTRDSHWRESLFNNELMTGFINNQGNPLSALTIASMLDLGYQVDFGAADPYVVPGGTFGLQAAQPFWADRVELVELPLPPAREIGYGR